MKKYYINSIFSRLFISFMLIMIPIYIVGGLIFTWSENAIKTEIKNSAISRINFLKNNLESETVRIKTLQGNFINDIDLNKLLFSEYKNYPVHEYYTAVSNVRKRLIILKNSSNFINDVVIYLPCLNKTISANVGYLDYIEEDFNKLLVEFQEKPYPIIFQDDKYSILMFFPFTNNSSVNPKYLVEMQLSIKLLENYIADFDTYPDSHIALFDHTVGKYIIGADNDLNFNESMKPDTIKKDNSIIDESIVNVKNKKYLMIHGFSDYLNVSLLEFIPVQSIFEIPNLYRKSLAVFFLLSIGVLFIYSFSTYKFVHVPIKTVLSAFHDLENGNLKTSIQYKKANEFMDLYDGFNKMVFRLNKLIDRVYVQELFAKKMELKQLQSQINPHFLYNSYFILHRMIKDKDFENAGNLSLFISKHYQYITRNAQDEVPLYKEVEYVKNYMKIQEFRFYGRFSVEFGLLDDKLSNIFVPRLILQPILENAIEHGIKDNMSSGMIHIRFHTVSTGLEITIEDNGENTTDDDISLLKEKLLDEGYDTEVTGIINVHRRIKLKYGEKSGLSISRSELGGLKVVIIIDTKEVSSHV
ncbi:MAG TPA: hypothetical protein DIW17_09840 [Clostridiales bacterium]|nr:histidine kinase [Clostridia bacterium]HCS74163.1 hypothetical protein [Clostridiales bacterium]